MSPDTLGSRRQPDMSAATVTSLLDLDRAGLEDFFATRGEKTFRASQVMKWIYGQEIGRASCRERV